jgi:uncharacterized RDD family membrane protein YckC
VHRSSWNSTETEKPSRPLTQQAPGGTQTAAPPQARPATAPRLARAETGAVPWTPTPAWENTARASTNLQYATFGARAIAAVIDVVILQIAGSMIDAMFMGALLSHISATSIMVATVGPLVANGVLTLFYCVWLESSPWQATLGKRMMGLKVVDVYGKGISFGRSSSRNVSKSLSVLTLGLGYLMPLWTSRRQALHDKAAGCLVIRAT